MFSAFTDFEALDRSRALTALWQGLQRYRGYLRLPTLTIWLATNFLGQQSHSQVREVAVEAKGEELLPRTPLKSVSSSSLFALSLRFVPRFLATFLTPMGPVRNNWTEELEGLLYPQKGLLLAPAWADLDLQMRMGRNDIITTMLIISYQEHIIEKSFASYALLTSYDVHCPPDLLQAQALLIWRLTNTSKH